MYIYTDRLIKSSTEKRLCLSSYYAYHTLLLLSLTLPVSVPQWRLLNSPGKMSKKFFGIRPRSKFFTREIKKPNGDDIKLQRGELTNILC